MRNSVSVKFTKMEQRESCIQHFSYTFTCHLYGVLKTCVSHIALLPPIQLYLASDSHLCFYLITIECIRPRNWSIINYIILQIIVTTKANKYLLIELKIGKHHFGLRIAKSTCFSFSLTKHEREANKTRKHPKEGTPARGERAIHLYTIKKRMEERLLWDISSLLSETTQKRAFAFVIQHCGRGFVWDLESLLPTLQFFFYFYFFLREGRK